MLHPKWVTNHYLNFMIKQPLVAENQFRTAGIEKKPLPTFEESRSTLPQPYWDGHEDALACWWKAWELAFQNMHQASPDNGYSRNYIDTAFNGNLFLWDTVFILFFARYGAHIFDFQGTLDNFYARQHEDGFICRELKPEPQGEMFHPHDPASTGPNLFAWCEWDYYLNTGDTRRIDKVFPVLLAYHRWLRQHRTWQDGSYWATGLARGMDNQPGSVEDETPQINHGHWSRIDATAQALLSAQCLSAMADLLGRQAEVQAEQREIELLAGLLNQQGWDASSGFYYDWHPQRGQSRVKSIAAYWPILTQTVPSERIARLIDQLNNPETFNRPHRIPCMAKDGPDYQDRGGYWRGGVWPPTNYMVLRGLSQEGYDDLAYNIASNHHNSVVQVFKDTGTLWEFYAPEMDASGARHDGKQARHDMVGWGGLGPIAVLLEYRFGLRPD
ncbi:MAG: trehalase family glycosidase, partial [Chloroflexota bacterium]